MLRPFLAALTISAILAGAPSAPAQNSAPGSGALQVADFTFRTVRPPSRGARKRIIFQSDNSVRAPKAQSYKWFWSEVDTATSAADPDRFVKIGALFGDRLASGWTGFGGADRARSFATDHQAAIIDAAARENLSPAFLLAVIAVESAGQPQAKSPKGAQGLMQLMPATARRFAVANPYDAAQNIAGGAAYLNLLLKMFEGDPLLALAGYNAGEGAVSKHKGVPPYAETRDYVPKVLAAFLSLRSLCVVPPANVRDACVLFEES